MPHSRRAHVFATGHGMRIRVAPVRSRSSASSMLSAVCAHVSVRIVVCNHLVRHA
jgi:hypothetical protein